MTGGKVTAGKLCKLKNRNRSKLFKELGVRGGEELGKIVEQTE